MPDRPCRHIGDPLDALPDSLVHIDEMPFD